MLLKAMELEQVMPNLVVCNAALRALAGRPEARELWDRRPERSSSPGSAEDAHLGSKARRAQLHRLRRPGGRGTAGGAGDWAGRAGAAPYAPQCRRTMCSMPPS